MLLRKSFSRPSRRGAAAVECAILAPFLCFAFVASIDFCRIFYYSLAVSSCARNGAIYGCVDQARATDAAGIEAAARAEAGNLDAARLEVSSVTDATSYVEVSVAYSFATITKYPGIPRQTDLLRTVRTKILPATPTFR